MVKKNHTTMGLLDLIFGSLVTEVGQTKDGIVILLLPLGGVSVDRVDINILVYKINLLFLNNLAGLLFGLVTFVFRESTVVGLSASVSKEVTTDRLNKTVSGS
jgi:hypothetical protein